MKRIAIAALLVVASALPANAAGADDAKAACARAHEQAQIARRDGKFREAKKQLLACMQESCPVAAQSPCRRWFDELRASMPTIVVEASDASGRSTFDAKLSIDGAVVAENLSSTAIEIDPGKHVARFEIAGAAPIDREFTILEGEKNKKIEVSFAPSAVTASHDGAIEAKPEGDKDRGAGSARPIPAGAIVFGAIGVAGAGAFAILGATGVAKENAIRDTRCAPSCDTGEVDAVRARYLAADIALGVGVAALATATIFFITRPTKNVQLAIDASKRARLGVSF